SRADLSLDAFEEQPVIPPQVTPGVSNSNTSATPTAPTIPPISTSRPSFTDTGTTVPQGSLQAENGATYTNNRDNTFSWTVPETLLRLGLTDNTEFRFITPDFNFVGEDRPGNIVNNSGNPSVGFSHHIANFGDLSVGFSHHIAAPGKTDVALVPMLNLPTGSVS